MKWIFGALAGASLSGACAVDVTSADPLAGVRSSGGAAGSSESASGGDRGSGGGGASGAPGRPASAPGVAYTASACAGASVTPGLTAGFPECSAVCGAPAHCVPTSLATGNAGFLSDCPDDGTKTAGKCVPDAMGETMGKFVLKKCVFFLNGGDARCVPRCIAARQSTSTALLAQDVCGSEEVCAPCLDPTHSSSVTHACDDFCGDPGPGPRDAGADSGAVTASLAGVAGAGGTSAHVGQ